MAKLTPTQKRVERLLPPLVRKMRRQQRQREAAAKVKAGPQGAEKRKRPRITIEELNAGGIKALKAKGITPKKVQDPDPRSGFEVVLDWVDLPRNLVAQVVGRLAGVDFSKVKERGTFGLKRVLMSQVLGKMGVKPGLGRAVAGFLGDVAIDPLTYLTAGATTGKRISKFLPRVKKSFFKELGGIAKGTARVLDPDLVRALGGATRVRRLQQLAQAGGRQAQKRLLGRGGGFLTRALERASTKATTQGAAARRVLQRGSLRGRKLFRIPFTQIAGPTIPGKGARAFKALGDVEEFRRLAETTRLPGEVRNILLRVERLRRHAANLVTEGNTAAASRARAAAKRALREARELAGITPRARQPGQFIPSGAKPGAILLEDLARGEQRLQRAGDLAPELLKLERISIEGRSPTTRLGMAWQKIFGPRMTPQRARELARRHGFTIGAADDEVRAFQRVQPETDTIIKSLIDDGLIPDNQIAGQTVLRDIIEVGGAEGLASSGLRGVNPNDPIRKLFNLAREADELNPVSGRVYHQIAGRDDVIELVRRYKEASASQIAQKQARGILAVEATGDVGGFARRASDQARPFLSDQSARVGGFASHQHRTRVVEFFDQTTGQRHILSEHSVDKINNLRNSPGVLQKVEVTSGGRAIPGRGEVLMLTPAQIAAEQAAGNTVTLKKWDASSQMIEQMLKDPDSQLLSRLGFNSSQADIPLFFNPDPAASFAARTGEHSRSMQAANLQAIARRSGALVDSSVARRPEFVNMRATKPLEIGHPLRQWLPPGIYDVAGDPRNPGIRGGGRSMVYYAPVADMLDRTAEMFRGGGNYNILLKATDMSLGWFKRFALYHPAYVIRNFWDNSFGIIMAGGNPIKALRLGMANKATRKIRKAVLAGDIGSLGAETMRIAGKDVPLQEIARFALENNMLQAGSTAAQTTAGFARGAGRTGRALGAAKGAGRYTLDGIRNINNWVEQNMRLGAFLSFLDEGQASRQALMNTTLAMPDLSNVSRFEREALVRIFPWYRWAKNNAARQFYHFIPQKPAFIASIRKFQNLIQGMAPTVPDNLRPEWMREAQAAQIGGDEESGNAFLLRNWFPFEEVQALTAGLASPQEAARFIAASTRPGIKAVAELATGQDIFRQRRTQPFTLAETLSQVPGAFVGASGTPLDNLLGIRPLREFRRVGEQPTLAGKIARGFLGGAIQPLSAERGRQEIDLKTRDAMRRLRQKIVRARENKDTVELQSLLRLFMQQQIKRQRTGLQIPRATQAALQAAGGT